MSEVQQTTVRQASKQADENAKETKRKSKTDKKTTHTLKVSNPYGVCVCLCVSGHDKKKQKMNQNEGKIPAIEYLPQISLRFFKKKDKLTRVHT